jgi:mRNA interferase RelE/StbE
VTEPYDIQLAASATRAIQDKPSENVAAAVIEFLTGSLRTNPRRVGKPLTRELRGRYAARRGSFRIIYSIGDAENLITVLSIGHRADVHRPR